MTERSDGVTDARIQAAKVIAGVFGVSREPGEGGRDRGDVSARSEGALHLLNGAEESSARSGGRVIE